MTLDIEIDVDDEFAADVDAGALRSAAAAALVHQQIADASVTVVVTTDETVRDLNRDYRGEDNPTDVLSFAARDGDDLIDGVPDDLRALLARTLGDVVIAYPYAVRQATRFGNGIGDELALLTVHGVLHLLGYDHATETEEAALWALQETILEPLGVSGLSFRKHG